MFASVAAVAAEPLLKAFLQQAVRYGIRMTIGQGERLFIGLDRRKSAHKIIAEGAEVLATIDACLDELDNPEISIPVIDHIFCELDVCFSRLQFISKRLDKQRR